MADTMKERAWKVAHAIPNPSDRADLREYMIYLEARAGVTKAPTAKS